MASTNLCKPGGLLEFYGVIAENLLRMRGKMSQEELARKAGVSRGTVANVEAGKGCRLDALFKIAAVLGVTPGDLCVAPGKKDELSMMAALFVERIMDYLPASLKEEIRRTK